LVDAAKSGSDAFRPAWATERQPDRRARAGLSVKTNALACDSGCGLRARWRSTTDREQRRGALGAVALPAGPTIREADLPSVGDRDLFAADAPALRSGVRRVFVRFNHPASLFAVVCRSSDRGSSSRRTRSKRKLQVQTRCGDEAAASAECRRLLFHVWSRGDPTGMRCCVGGATD
jgi:hypothetical protein